MAWLLVLLAVYGTPEPVTMLALAARSPGQFLRRRLALGLGYAAASALPFGLLLGVGPAGWGAALAVSLFWLALVAMLILTKYAFYPNAQPHSHHAERGADPGPARGRATRLPPADAGNRGRAGVAEPAAGRAGSGFVDF
ncbi:MAG: hypothetical protein WKG07_14910 [Hymenobacter sp.]